MILKLLLSWLKCFNDYVLNRSERKFFLFVGNCLEHGSTATLHELHNVEACFLAPEIISRIQTLDIGSVAAIKAAYRRRFLFPVFDKIYAKVKALCNVYSITATHCLVDEKSGLATKTTESSCDSGYMNGLSFDVNVNTHCNLQTILQTSATTPALSHTRYRM